ncbi:hypothetical protein BRN38_14975, partial [Xanthomonas oryzae pv. oryzae]
MHMSKSYQHLSAEERA